MRWCVEAQGSASFLTPAPDEWTEVLGHLASAVPFRAYDLAPTALGTPIPAAVSNRTGIGPPIGGVEPQQLGRGVLACARLVMNAYPGLKIGRPVAYRATQFDELRITALRSPFVEGAGT